jgi:hypothetical protein
MCKLTGRNATTQILLNMALKTHNSNLYVTFQYIKAIANFRKDSEVDFSSDKSQIIQKVFGSKKTIEAKMIIKIHQI